MTSLKPFERFAHEGVMTDLNRVKLALLARGNYEFGSSGEGELTARRKNTTSYTRKYKTNNGWRIEVCRGGKSLHLEHPETLERIIEIIANYEE